MAQPKTVLKALDSVGLLECIPFNMIYDNTSIPSEASICPGLEKEGSAKEFCA